MTEAKRNYGYMVSAYYNVTLADRGDGEKLPKWRYDAGDAVAFEDSYYVLTTSPELAADAMWARLNADDRWNGRQNRSMSTGDVLHVRNEDTGEVVWLAVEGSGFSTIEAPKIAEGDDIDAYFELTKFPRYRRQSLAVLRATGQVEVDDGGK